jgi:hypothetical protein
VLASATVVLVGRFFLNARRIHPPRPFIAARSVEATAHGSSHRATALVEWEPVDDDDIPSLVDMQAGMRQLADAFAAWVRAQVGPASTWREARLEVRYAADRSFSDHKMRVQTVDRRTVSLGSNSEIPQLLVALNRLRRALGWYSMTLRIDSTGNATADYGYDPAAVDDPSFWDD